MTTAPTIRERLIQRFDLWDGDGNGRLDRGDFEAEARNVLKAFGEPADSPRGREVMTTYIDLWNYIADKSGSTEEVTRERFAEVGEEIIGRDATTGWAAVVRPHIAAMAQLCDADDDGRIDQGEFAKWLRAVGAEGAPVDAFRQIDSDNDGYLTIDELCTAVAAHSEGRLEVSLLR